jgi:hypothetical protein
MIYHLLESAWPAHTVHSTPSPRGEFPMFHALPKNLLPTSALPDAPVVDDGGRRRVGRRRVRLALAGALRRVAHRELSLAARLDGCRGEYTAAA